MLGKAVALVESVLGFESLTTGQFKDVYSVILIE
ncbi:hypothetical protein VPHD479_0387 [Vibrio phage D479]